MCCGRHHIRSWVAERYTAPRNDSHHEGSNTPVVTRWVIGATSPSVSHTSAAATPASRVVAPYGRCASSRRATCSHSRTASNSGTTHDGRTSVDMHPSMRPSTDDSEQPKERQGSAPDPGPPSGGAARRATLGRWVVGRLRRRSAAHRDATPPAGPQAELLLAPPPPARPCYARPTDGEPVRQSS